VLASRSGEKSGLDACLGDDREGWLARADAATVD